MSVLFYSALNGLRFITGYAQCLSVQIMVGLKYADVKLIMRYTVSMQNELCPKLFQCKINYALSCFSAKLIMSILSLTVSFTSSEKSLKLSAIEV